MARMHKWNRHMNKQYICAHLPQTRYIPSNSKCDIYFIWTSTYQNFFGDGAYCDFMQRIFLLYSKFQYRNYYRSKKIKIWNHTSVSVNSILHFFSWDPTEHIGNRTEYVAKRGYTKFQICHHSELSHSNWCSMSFIQTPPSQAAFIHHSFCFYQECPHHHLAKCRTTWPGQYLSMLCSRLKCIMLHNVCPYLLHDVAHVLCVPVWVSLGYMFNFTTSWTCKEESSGHIHLGLRTGLQHLSRRNSPGSGTAWDGSQLQPPLRKSFGYAGTAYGRNLNLTHEKKSIYYFIYNVNFQIRA